MESPRLYWAGCTAGPLEKAARERALTPLRSGSHGAKPCAAGSNVHVLDWSASGLLVLGTSGLLSDLLASRAADTGILHGTGCLIPARASWAP